MSYNVETESPSDKYDLSVVATGGPLFRTQLGRGHLVERNLQGLMSIQSAVVGLNAAQSTIVGARFIDSQIVRSDFVFVTLTDCFFKGVVFEDCTFRHTKFVRCTFDSCRFSFARPVALDDELVMEDCIFLEGAGSLRELTLEKEIRFQICTFQGEALPENIKRDQFLITPPPVAPKAAAPRPTTAPIAAKTATVREPEPPASAPVPPPARSANATRFDKLEM